MAALKAPIDPDAFLDWERRQAERHELVGCSSRMMVGAAMGHNTVADSFLVALAVRLCGSPCRAWRADTRANGASGEFT